MPKIKTREKVHGIKTLDKAAVEGERMKEAYIRSKEEVTNLTDDRSENPNAYAGDKVQRAAEMRRKILLVLLRLVQNWQ